MGKASRRKKLRKSNLVEENINKNIKSSTNTKKKNNKKQKKKEIIIKIKEEKDSNKSIKYTEKNTKKESEKKESIKVLNKEKKEIELEIKNEPKKVFLEKLKEKLRGSYKELRKTTEKYKELLISIKKELKIIIKGGALFLLGIFVFVAVLISVEAYSHNRILAKTNLGNIELGYKKYEQAKEDLQNEVKEYFEKPIMFSFGGKDLSITPNELGIEPLVEQTVNSLQKINFKTITPKTLLASLFFETKIKPIYKIDNEKLIKVVENNFLITNSRAKNASLVYEENNLNILPEKDGIKINSEKLLKELNENINQLNSKTILIEVEEEKPRINIEQLEVEKERIIKLLEKPIKIKYEDFSATINLLDHLDSITFEDENLIYITNNKNYIPVVLGEESIKFDNENIKIQTKINIKVDSQLLEELLTESFYSKIEKPTSGANIYKNSEGKVVIEGKGEDGKKVNKEALSKAVNLAINNGLNEVPTPVSIEKAPLKISEDLKKLGIKELVATGHSAYYGSSQARMFNIEHGSAKYNGYLIKPGEEFSFNEVLGPVDASSGFKPEKVIKQDKMELEYGGGICQVSTTFYRTALIAGLPITERRPHSWKVSYYAQSMGDGLDATIYPGVVDFKFINDTPAHLLVQAYTEGAESYFKLYGTDDGRKVELQGPFGGGLTYRWNRIIKSNGEEKVEEIWSRYKPIPVPEAPKPKPEEKKENTGFNF